MGLFISHSILLFLSKLSLLPSCPTVPLQGSHESPAAFCFGLHSIESRHCPTFPVNPWDLTRNSPAVNPHQAIPFVIRLAPGPSSHRFTWINTPPPTLCLPSISDIRQSSPPLFLLPPPYLAAALTIAGLRIFFCFLL